MSNVSEIKPFSDFPTYNVCQYNGAKRLTSANETEQKQTSKKINKAGVIISSSAVVGTGVAVLFLTRGANSKLYRRISDFSSDLANKINESELSGKSKSFFESVNLVFSKGLKKLLDVFKFSANTVAVRDSAVDKFMRKHKVTGAFSEGTMKFYNRIATRELDKRYDVVESGMRNFSAVLADNVQRKFDINKAELDRVISIKGVEKPLKEWLRELAGETARVKTTFEAGFSKEQRIARDRIRDIEFSTLPERQWNRITKDGGIFNLSKYKNYITEELTQDTSLSLRRQIQSSRKLFTNNVKHEYNGIKHCLNGISGTMRMDDHSGRKILSQLFEATEEFRKCSGAAESVQRDDVIKRMQECVEVLEKQIADSNGYSSKNQASLLKQLSYFKEMLSQAGENSKGGLQRISTIINGLSSCENPVFSQSEYKGFKKSIDKITKRMNYATNLESDDYFIKRAELKIGSAPTDIAGLLAPVGIGAYAIAKGKDKDEKISAALTAAVPLVGSIGTYIYGTVKMFNAPKNLVFSIITGFALNQLGNFAVKLYKAYSEKQSFIKLATDAYKKTFKENELQENNEVFALDISQTQK